MRCVSLRCHGIVDAIQSHPISSNPIPSHGIASHRRRYPIPSYPILPNPFQPYPIAFDPIPSFLCGQVFFKVFQRRLTSKNCGWMHKSTLVVLYSLRGIMVGTKNHRKNNTVVWVTCVQFLAHNGFTLNVPYVANE